MNDLATPAAVPAPVNPAASVFGMSGQSIGRQFSAAAKRAGYRAVADAHTAPPAEASKKPWTNVLMPIRPFGSRRAGS